MFKILKGFVKDISYFILARFHQNPTKTNACVLIRCTDSSNSFLLVMLGSMRPFYFSYL